MIAAKAEGNPFYVEELVKSLQESGALRRAGAAGPTRPLAALAVPGSIHDIITARIDRLAEAPKRTLQLAVGDRPRVHAAPGGPPRRDPGARRRASCAS